MNVCTLNCQKTFCIRLKFNLHQFIPSMGAIYIVLYILFRALYIFYLPLLTMFTSIPSAVVTIIKKNEKFMNVCTLNCQKTFCIRLKFNLHQFIPSMGAIFI